uniref:Uncharacterized protein n=1 Tax=Arundo donax TaxID=35708 RepID=A0A0A8ZD16_ARUDO
MVSSLLNKFISIDVARNGYRLKKKSSIHRAHRPLIGNRLMTHAKLPIHHHSWETYVV